ncbi:TetR/AcrR family transcriptional regulator C-terminal domain-containing protein [Leifsonia sp. NCR5]|uniref:TetR/AcrR family transcriptional regulator C-terminal domain-containing protein n=1 Tax=Leifsonia sp. NCR5 TaxID=1978342 RepID=UPI0015C4567C|nr:TetR/AcrR family transcriptional regulator C-terminal domain-containing protein [Leifsonia sp. NCR5]
MPRPSSPILSPDRIADAAIELVDAGKPFGVNALARQLGVTPSSLYNHVDGRDAIVELMRGRLAERAAIVVPDGLAWDAVVEYVVREQRAMFSAHPLVLPLLVGKPVTDATVLGYYEALAEALLDAGFPEGDVLVIVAILDAFALGSGLDLSAPPQVWRARQGTALARLVDTGEPGDVRADRAFDLGVELLLGSLRARLAGRDDFGH